MKKQLKPFPSLHSDEEAEDFVANADLTEYDFSGGHYVQYVFRKKEAGEETEKHEMPGRASAAKGKDG